MLLFLVQDLGSGDEKVRKSDVKKFLTPGYSTSGHVELYTVSLENASIQRDALLWSALTAMLLFLL